MRWEKVLNVVHAHAEGEVGRVTTGGVLDVPGKTMFDKKSYLERERDWLRRMVLFEPRGSAAMSVNLLLAPSTPKADAGMIIMESTDYPPMSGSEPPLCPSAHSSSPCACSRSLAPSSRRPRACRTAPVPSRAPPAPPPQTAR